MFCPWTISTVLLIVSRLRQSRMPTACFSVVTEYIKTIAFFLLGAGLFLRGFSVSYWAALLRLRQWRHSFPSCCCIHSLAWGVVSPSPTLPKFLDTRLFCVYSLIIFILFPMSLAVPRLCACVMSTGYERICARRPYIRRFALARSDGLRLRLPTEYSISWRKPVEHNLPPDFGDTNSASCAATCHLYFLLCSLHLSISLMF